MPIQLNPTSSSGWKTVVKPVAKPVTPAPSPVKPDLSLTREWKPTPKQFKVDQLHLQRFDLKDRFDRNESIRMFMVWKNYHHKDSEPEVIARNWNGGPKGYKVSRTEKYWNKIEKQLNK